jgi:hypothetical protein
MYACHNQLEHEKHSFRISRNIQADNSTEHEEHRSNNYKHPSESQHQTSPPLETFQQESIVAVVYLYNILGWSSFPSIRPAIRPVIHPSKFLIPEEEDDGRGGEDDDSWRQQQLSKHFNN